MAGYLDTYGAGEEQRAKVVRAIALWGGIAPQAREDFEDEEDEREEEIPAARAPRKKAAPRASARKS